MILVNNPGDWGHIYGPLKHSDWNGCTPTDLIFPFFLFIIGVSIVFSLKKKKERNLDQSKQITGIARRSVIIFGLGIILALLPLALTDPIEAFKTVRIPGVLQRIALVYFFTAVIFLKSSLQARAWMLVFILLLYWALMAFVPVPNTGYPSLEKETNMGAWLDRLVFTPAHLWKESNFWDPEGLLGTMPSIATALIGVLVGIRLNKRGQTENEKATWLTLFGAVMLASGAFWGLYFPINKALWTSSYVLYTGGFACLSLAGCYWLIDVKGYQRWTKPFVVYGVNAITVFFFSAIIAKALNFIKLTTTDGRIISAKEWIYKQLFASNFSDYNASLMYAICFVLFWQAVLWWMYNKKIIVKV